MSKHPITNVQQALSGVWLPHCWDSNFLPASAVQCCPQPSSASRDRNEFKSFISPTQCKCYNENSSQNPKWFSPLLVVDIDTDSHNGVYSMIQFPLKQLSHSKWIGNGAILCILELHSPPFKGECASQFMQLHLVHKLDQPHTVQSPSTLLTWEKPDLSWSLFNLCLRWSK